MKVIVDQGSPDYYELRAAELIGEARRAVELAGVHSTDPTMHKTYMEEYDRNMERAISLLALARLTRKK